MKKNKTIVKNIQNNDNNISKKTIINKNRDSSIQIIRIISMLFIIICHFCDCSNNKLFSPLGQFFNIGVFIFIFISGYLYGEKKIDDNKKWLMLRIKKIIIPVYIFIIFLLFVNSAITEVFQFKYLIIYLSNLQYFFGGIKGGGHLWFITVITICYLLVPLLNKNKEKLIKEFRQFTIIIIVSSILLGLISKTFGLLGFYIYIFCLGYFIKNNKKFIKTKYWKLLLFMIAGLIIRILGKYLFDNTLFYETTITAITHTIITVCLFVFLYKILSEKSIKENSISDKLINFIDELSYYIFIVHYIFMIGPISLMSITKNMLINVIIFSILTLTSAYILKTLTSTISKINLKKIKKLDVLQFIEIYLIVLYKYLLSYNYRNSFTLYSLIILSGIIFLIIIFIKRKEILLKDIIIFSILISLSLITVYTLTSVNFIFPLMIAMSFYNEDPKKIAKYYFWALTICFIMTLSLNAINVLPDRNLSRLVNGNSMIRYSLGFMNTAFVMLYYIFICLAFYCAYGYSKEFIITSLFFGIALYCLCLSRTGLISLIIFELLVLLLNKNWKFINKILSWIVPHLFHILLIFVIIITVLSQMYDMSAFNSFLSGRIDFNLQLYEEGYFYNLFGTRKELGIPLDNYYLYPLVKMGIIGCIFYTSFNFLGLFKLRKFNYLMIIESIILIYGLGDSNVVVSSINFMLSIQAMTLINSKNKYLIEGEFYEEKRIN